MKKVAILQNIANEEPGLLTDLLDEADLKYEIIHRERGEKIGPLDQYSAMIVMGGSDSANDQSEKILGNLETIHEVLRMKMPYFGICLGLQLGVKATGGQVIKNPVKEAGCRDPQGNFFRVDLVEKSDPIVQNLPDNFHVFHLHGETVELTAKMSLLAAGKFCRNQFVRIQKNAYGVQFHLELTPEMFEDWAANDIWLKEMDQEKLKKDFASQCKNYKKNLYQIFRNFLKIL